MTDFYSTLGVAETATDAEIKAAFRKLAMEHHPDKNQGNDAAEAKFKEINEAYQTLSDTSKRAEYDQMRKYGGMPGGNGFRGNPRGFRQGPNEFHFEFGGDPGNVDDIIRQFFHQNGFRGPFGQPRPQRNRDINVSIEVGLEDILHGKDMPLTIDNNGTSVNIVARIPAGVEHGTKMRFQGHGDSSIPNIPPGDLFVNINIRHHPIFRRDRQSLHAEMKIDAIDAILGHKFDFDCIDGSKINIDIPAGTQHGNVLRISGKGVPVYQHPDRRGDLFLTVAIVIPKDLTEDQIKNLKKVSNSRRK